MEGKIIFDAKVGAWVCIKKQKIDEGIDGMDVARALASIHDSMDRKIWEFVGKEIELENLDTIAYEITGAQFNKKKKRWELKGRKSEAQFLKALEVLNSQETIKKMNINNKEHAKLEIAKAYLNRKVLDLLSFRLELNPKIAEKYIEEKAKLA